MGVSTSGLTFTLTAEGGGHNNWENPGNGPYWFYVDSVIAQDFHHDSGPYDNYSPYNVTVPTEGTYRIRIRRYLFNGFTGEWEGHFWYDANHTIGSAPLNAPNVSWSNKKKDRITFNYSQVAGGGTVRGYDYELHWYNWDTGQWVWVASGSSGTSGSWTPTGLKTDTLYRFRCWQTNYRGSGPGREVQVWSWNYPSAPSTPWQTNPDYTSFRVNWSGGGSTDGGVKRYEVSKDGGATWVSAGTNTYYDFTGLTQGTSYEIRVRAVDSEELVSAASSASMSTLKDVTPPNTPATLAVAMTGDTQATVTWDTTPASQPDPGTSGFQGFWQDLTLYTPGVGLSARNYVDRGSAGSATHTVLMGSTYEAAVYSRDNAGNTSTPRTVYYAHTREFEKRLSDYKPLQRVYPRMGKRKF